VNRYAIWALALVFCAGLFAQEFTLGSKVTDFQLTDVNGKTVQLASLKGGVTVLMFIATQCPVSNAYNERMQAVYRDYSGKGVKFIGINSNNTEPAPEVAAHRQENGFGFEVYKDPGNAVADRFAAGVTPEIFVLDKGGVIRYHGYIDDSQKPENIKKQGLRPALDEMLGGKAVTLAETKAFGCTIKRVKKAS